MRGQIQLHPLPTSEAKKCAWETDADFTSLVATAIDFSQQTDTLQHPLKGNGQHLHEGTNSAPSPSYLRGKRSVHGKPTLIFTSLVATAIDFSQQTDTLQHPLKGNGQHLHEGTNSAPSPSYLQRQRSVHGKPTLIFTSLVATAIDFSQQTDTLQHPLKGTANICMRGTNSAPSPFLPPEAKEVSIPFLPPEAKKCAWETDADFTSLVATAIDFSQQTDTLQHPLKGNGQHLHEGDKFSSIPFLPPEAKKCAWETDADFTSLVATAIDFSQQTDTLQHPLKGNGQHLHEGTNSAPSPSYLRGKEVCMGNRR
ncbi:hypothetical protein CEXT_723731 [Caerostris extrusa]|uniref:Uncharacterized protein n=1 Tax=Caerostris extrusa TaxID=172846 RepID=A0AAV4M4Y5_CAEEX|nr:hypothetical protein CEXT_723731 [Caerostris extrusa]